jgi:chemotaxis methyl-accepting protein methylase
VEIRATNRNGAAFAIARKGDYSFDVIFGHNMLKYLTASRRYSVLEQMITVVAFDGMLLLDPAEYLGRANYLFRNSNSGNVNG